MRMINTKFKKLVFSEEGKKRNALGYGYTGSLKCIYNFLFLCNEMKKSETNMEKCKHLFKLRGESCAFFFSCVFEIFCKMKKKEN